MAYSVDKDVLLNGNNIYIVRCTAVSDGTLTAGEEILIDKSALTGPLPGIATGRLSVEEIWYSIQGFESILLYWDHTTDDPIARLTGDGYVCFKEYGGLVDPNSAGGTGDLCWAYAGAGADTSGDTFTITIKAKKKQ